KARPPYARLYSQAQPYSRAPISKSYSRAPRSTTRRAPTPPQTRDLAQPLQDQRHPLAAADAHRLQPELLVVPLQRVDQRAGDARAGHPEGVADGDRAAVHVQLVQVDPQVLVGRDDLRGER